MNAFSKDNGARKQKVSVLMPTYNNVRFLPEAVESILAQTLQDFEFIVVDDGSDDGTDEVISKYAGEDERIRVMRIRVNRGIVHALNTGLHACRGDYVARMDSDDISCRDRLERQVSFLDAHPEVMVLGAAAAYIDSTGKEIGFVRPSTPELSLLAQNPLLHPTVVMRREALTNHDLRYRERYRYAEDYFLWLELSRFGRLAALPEVLLKYRISENASRLRHVREMIAATLKVKAAGVFVLGIRPQPLDILRFIMEAILWMIPAAAVRHLYLKQIKMERVPIVL